jgi:signal transduction histidine kinase/ABC-type amino acid transport substrate-binding protein
MSRFHLFLGGLALPVAAVVLVSSGAVPHTAVQTPRTVRVVMDSEYAPFAFQSDDGKLQGILIDQWHAWERKTGIKAEIHAMDWAEALQRMRAGEFDVIDCIVETAERQDYFDFTPAYAVIEASIFFRSDISGITDLASLKGFPVGVKAGDQHIDKLKVNGVTTVIPFRNNDAIIKAAQQHKINVFLADAPSALYLLNKAGVEDEFRRSAPIFRDVLRRAVRKGDAALLRTVSDGFAAVDPGELKQIDEKWFGRTINRYGRYLTYAGYAAAAAIVLIAGLAVWNRMLRKRILQRTAALGESEQGSRQIAEQLRALSARLQSAREEEATRIAREIHDELGQALTAVKLECTALFGDLRVDEGPSSRRKHSVFKLLDDAIQSVRRIATELRPGILDDLGLAAAVEWVAAEFQVRTGMTVQVSVPDVDLALDRERATALFRILQEALTNVARHAKATQVSVRLAEEDGILTLEVHDNGQGIGAEQLSASNSLGIAGMRERALLLGGGLIISSTPEFGTTVKSLIPETPLEVRWPKAGAVDW